MNETAKDANVNIDKERGHQDHDIAEAAVELGIEVGHVKEVKGADKVFGYASIEAITVTEKQNSHLLRKIDLRVLPWLCGLYVLQYLDKGVYVSCPLGAIGPII